LSTQWTPPTREAILDALRAADRPLSPVALAHRLSVSDEHFPILQRRLIAMERDGQLLPNRKGVLLLASRLDLVPGRVQGHRDGFGFLLPDAGGPDYFLSPREMQKVMHGDRVLGRLSGYDPRGRPEAVIVEVTDRAHRTLVGRFLNERGVHIVVPEDQRIKHDIIVAPADTGEAQHGQVVSIEILTPPVNGAPPIGRVVEVLGEIDDPGMEIEIAVRKFDVPHAFGEVVQQRLADLPAQVRPADRRGRVDLRDVALVTIDGEDARDFDDAVYCERVQIDLAHQPGLDIDYRVSPPGPAPSALTSAGSPGARHGEARPAQPTGAGQSEPGFRLIVAIADVAHYVKPGDPIDREAQDRGTSVYFPRRVIPMLPEPLSNGLCSLNPQVDRLVLVCDALIDQSGRIRAYQFYEAVIRSAARLTYEEVWALLSGSSAATLRMPSEKTALLPHLTVLHELFRVLIAARAARGAIEIETVETRIVCDALGRIEEIIPYARNDAHRLIEECMLAANVCAADIMVRHTHPGLFRVHEGPTPERLTQLRELLRSVGLSLGGASDPSPADYARLAGQVRGRPDEALLQTVILRSMQQAIYTPDNVGHFGLAYRAYAHFTSPIRRYPDLLTHRVIKALLKGRRFLPKPVTEGEDAASPPGDVEGIWQRLGVMCSSFERRADDASRDVAAWLKCQFMRERVGEQFAGRITGVASFGLFVTLNDLFVEGMVHVSELGGEYFQYSDSAHELRGERTGRRFRLTDPIDVQVSRVDLEARRIEFRMIPSMINAARRVDADEQARSPGVSSAEVPKRRARKAAPAKSEAAKKARAERAAAGQRRKLVAKGRGKTTSSARRKRRS
jgi:ribonuclease R